MSRKKDLDHLISEPKETKAPKETIKEATKPPIEHAMAQLVDLVVTYTNYSRGQARNIISGVIARSPDVLVDDVIDWCIHIKATQDAILVIDDVAKGNALVEKIDGKWKLIERLGDSR